MIKSYLNEHPGKLGQEEEVDDDAERSTSLGADEATDVG